MNKQFFKIPVIFFLFILSIFLYLLIIDRNPSDIPSNLLNKNVPIFETKSLFSSEKFISHKEFGDEPMIVNFFATWCKPCRDEHVYIKNFAKEKKVKVIGINYKDDPEKAIKWLKEFGNPYANVAIDKKGRIAIDWGVYGIPETFLINSSGIIRYRHVGPITKSVFKKINLMIAKID
jgi:cytochrome c biogenesis protein CcmG, thiol:disulfide interchange protein DsbE